MDDRITFQTINESGCLSDVTIRNYIEGHLNSEDLIRVESHLSECDFCKTAVNGIQLYSTGNDYVQNIFELKTAWYKKKQPAKNNKSNFVALTAILVAAVLIPLSLFIIFKNIRNVNIIEERFAYSTGNELDAVLAENNIIPYRKNDENDINKVVVEKELLDDIERTTESVLPVARIKSANILANNDNESSDDSNITSDNGMDNRRAYLHYPYIINHQPPEIESEDESEQNSSVEDFFMISEMPRFNGSSDMTHFTRFIQKSLHYPNYALRNNIKGTVLVQFTVNKEGVITNPEILNNCPGILAGEVLRILDGSPVWEPGMQRNKPVEVSFVIPVHFQIEN